MKNQHVLLVDDDKDFAEAIKTTLEKQEAKVTVAHDGEEGLKKAQKLQPDMIILDVIMPKKDGYSVAHELKSHEETKQIPILMLTSLGSEENGKVGAEKIAMGHQIDAFLEKPVEPAELVEKLKVLGEIAENKKAEGDTESTILLIDDDTDFIAAVKTILEENGYKVKTAYTGEDGLMNAIQWSPDLILLDVMLPEKDGFAVCKELKEGDKTRSIPVIMLTSVSQKITDPDFAKAIAITHRADDYIEKPVDAKELLSHIKKFIGPMHRLV
jgi:two-component system alkaline phosphatase synthesis response regulator PhoP